jgi:hypothetical protein
MPNDMAAQPPAEREQRANFPAMLKQYGAEIARALPKHMNGDRMARIALTAFRSTPALSPVRPEERLRGGDPVVAAGPRGRA